MAVYRLKDLSFPDSNDDVSQGEAFLRVIGALMVMSHSEAVSDGRG